MTPSPTELELVCADFSSALDLLRSLGMRLDLIYPADDPHSAILRRDGGIVRLTSRPEAPAPSTALPDFQPEFLVTRALTACGEGRAGMIYRDLIPSRLGGRYIASHIAIPEGGPVADWVHYHHIALQLICVRTGWVRVVYQDQGEPFVMSAGDMVLQPPGIRHRVIESAPGLEVVEITCPALHATFADHDMVLPNRAAEAARTWGGQHFLHHRSADARWRPWHGAEAQETGLCDATGGLADARILRRGAAATLSVPAHHGELVFGFLLEGSARLDHGYALGPADCFVIPPGEGWSLSDASNDLRLLHVTAAKLTEIGALASTTSMAP